MSRNAKEDSEWRSETKGDLKRAQKTLTALSSVISGGPTEEQLRSIWLAYLLVEKSVVFIKVELDEENPGRFISQKAYTVPDERQAVGFALRHLEEAILRFEAGELPAALKALRESRNYLRVLVKRTRRERLKRKKSA